LRLIWLLCQSEETKRLRELCAVIHVFVLIMTIGGVEVANDDCREAMCFRSIDTCNEFAAKLRQRGSPSTSIGITAYCKPILVDPTQDGVKIY